MSVERVFYCDGPAHAETPEHEDRCGVHVRTLRAVPPTGSGFVSVETAEFDVPTRHFCGWECVMRYAATQPAPERVE